MKHRILPITVFLFFILTAIFSGRNNYRTTRNEIAADLNQALAKMIAENGTTVITQDTIRTYKLLREIADEEVLIALSDKRYRSYLKNEKVKETAFLTFDILDQHGEKNSTNTQNIYSDTLIINHSGETLALKGYSQLSAAAVFSMSDQRLSIACMTAAFLWAILSCSYLKKKQQHKETDTPTGFGGLSYSEREGRFYDATQIPIHFTPMQQQFMSLLWEAPSHALSKKEICDALWPGKEDANDTLYTLVRRLKPIVEQHTNLKVTADRCGRYTLTIKDL